MKKLIKKNSQEHSINRSGNRKYDACSPGISPEKETTIAEMIRMFDTTHLIKQIILIGEDGVVRNVELDFMEDEESITT